MIIKRLAAMAAAIPLIGAGLVAVAPETAEAAVSNWRVDSASATCITAYDHIDQNGHPYGTRVVRCAGQQFPTNVDWDIVTWPAITHYLKYRNNTGVAWTSCSTGSSGSSACKLGRKKISSSTIIVKTVRR